MATHDYSIANQSFPATRTDINNALAAIKSSNSAATAPTSGITTGQVFYDTTNNVLKVYNGNTFVELLSGTITDSNIGTDAVGASELKVSGNGTTSQYLRSDADGTFTWATPTNTTYTADGNYGITLSGTSFRLEDDRRRNSSTTDVYSGNTHDYTFYDQDIGIRWYTSGSEEMRLENDGDLHVDGNIVAYSTTVSDERLKISITPVADALTKVLQLNGVEFTRKDSGTRSAGVIAQEVEKVLPQAVKETKLPLQTGDENTLYKTVEYDALHSLYIESIKELKELLDVQNNKIQELEAKLIGA